MSLEWITLSDVVGHQQCPNQSLPFEETVGPAAAAQAAVQPALQAATV